MIGDGTKTDELSKKFQRRAGHFQSKKLNCRFWTFPGLTTTRECPFPGYRSLFEVSAIKLSILSFTASILIAYAVYPFFCNFMKVSKTMVSAVSYVVITSYYGHDAYCEKCNLILS